MYFSRPPPHPVEPDVFVRVVQPGVQLLVFAVAAPEDPEQVLTLALPRVIRVRDDVTPRCFSLLAAAFDDTPGLPRGGGGAPASRRIAVAADNEVVVATHTLAIRSTKKPGGLLGRFFGPPPHVYFAAAEVELDGPLVVPLGSNAAGGHATIYCQAPRGHPPYFRGQAIDVQRSEGFERARDTPRIPGVLDEALELHRARPPASGVLEIAFS